MIYTADEIDGFFKSGALVLIGMGSRRACYRLPGNDRLCIKCYRSDEEIRQGKTTLASKGEPLSKTVVKEILSCRFDEKRNTCCQEYRYWADVICKSGDELKAYFPYTMEMVLVPSRGWCLVEELITNEDGSAVVRFMTAWKAAGTDERKKLFAALSRLEDAFVKGSIRFFDPQNIMVQRAQGELRLRVPDFEPATRTLIPVDVLFPAVTGLKIRRRFKRYRKLKGIAI